MLAKHLIALVDADMNTVKELAKQIKNTRAGTGKVDLILNGLDDDALEKLKTVVEKRQSGSDAD